MKKILIVTYGGGHVNIVRSILPQLLEENVSIEILALTIASSNLKKAGIQHNTIRDYIDLLPYKQSILELGEKAIQGKHDIRSDITYEDAVVYHGIGMFDLINECGKEKAWSIFEANGRKAFCPVNSMIIILKRIKPDVIVLPTGVRFEEAFAKAANLMDIPVVLINDLPVLGNIDFNAKICVMNKWSKDYIKAHSDIKSSELIITGQPVMEKNLIIDEETLKNVQCSLKEGYDKVVLFLGTPTLDIFPEVAETINKLLELAKHYPKIKFIIRPHPGNLDDYGLVSKDNIIVTKNGELKYLLAASDLIITQVSTAGLEAILLGKPVITVLNKTNPDFKLSDTGGAINMENADELERVIDKCLTLDSEEFKRNFDLKNKFDNKKNASANIIEVIFSSISDKEGII